jgi:hypothetical protein
MRVEKLIDASMMRVLARTPLCKFPLEPACLIMFELVNRAPLIRVGPSLARLLPRDTASDREC